MNETLKVKIEGDIKGLERELTAADKLLKQHERNYKGVQNAISQNTEKSRELTSAIRSLNSEFDKGKVSEKDFARETDRLSTELREVNNETKDYQKELKRLDSEMDRATASIQQYQGAASNTVNANNKVAGSVQNLGNATRVNAVPAMTSLSQVMQDAPYGIQGVANNIQQLTMQMGYLSRNAGGTKAALSAMVSSLMGPAGILMAVSLITSAMVMYSNKLRSAKSDTDELTDATQKAREELDRFIDSLNNVEKVDIGANVKVDQELAALRQLERQMVSGSNTAKQREDAYNELNKRFPETLANYKKETLLVEGLGSAYDEIAKKVRENAGSSEAQKQINDNLEYRNKLLIRQGVLNDEIAEQRAEVSKQEERAVELLSKNMAGAESAATKARKAQKDLNDLIKEQETVTNNIDALNKQNITLSNKITFIPDEVSVDTKKAKVSEQNVRIPVKAVLEVESIENNQMEWVAMLEEQISQLELAQSKFPVFSEAYKQLGEAIDFAKDRVSGFNTTLQEGARATTDAFAKRNEEIQLLDQAFLAEQMMMAAQMSQVFGSIATNVVDSMLEGKLGVKEFVNFTIKAFAQLMIQLAQQAIAEKIMSKVGLATDHARAQGNAAVIASSAAAAAGPAGVALLPGLLASMSGVIGGFFAGISGFQDGGIVGGQSYSGDKILARLNSGELILNADQQRRALALMNAPAGMSGGASGAIEIVGETVISGEEIHTVWTRYEQSNSRAS